MTGTINREAKDTAKYRKLVGNRLAATTTAVRVRLEGLAPAILSCMVGVIASACPYAV